MLSARHPAVIFSNAIGDHLLNLPAIRALATLFKNRLALICNRGATITFFSDIRFRAVCEIDTETVTGGRVFDAESVAQSLGPCDLLVSLNPWHSASLSRLLEVLSPRHSIGFFPGFEVVLARDYSKHSAELAFDVPRFIDPKLTLDDFADPPTLPAFYVRQAQRIRDCIPPEFRVLAVHADTKPDKMWPAPRFVSVLKKFLERNPEFIVFELGARDQGLDSGSDDSRVVPCYGLALPASLSLLGRADLFLGVDSSLLHAADLFRVAGVGLFGPTNCHEWGFRFSKGRHVSGNGSMDNITEAEVLDALESLLIETSEKKRNRTRFAVAGGSSPRRDTGASATPAAPRYSSPEGLPADGKRVESSKRMQSTSEHDLDGRPASGIPAWDFFREKGYEIRACYIRTYFSAIYRAVRLSDGLAVAIKLLAPVAALETGNERDQLVKKFAREVRALHAVRAHPGGITLLESGDAQGWPYHVCGWVGGRTVADLLAARVALDLTAVLRIALDTATFIQWLHSEGLVHRDIAPDHVFVNEDGKTCLIDFGMAEFQTEMSLTAARKYVGQDIRSIGLMLYEMWTGKQTFSYGRPILRNEVAQGMRHLDSICPRSAVAEVIKRSIISGSRKACDGEQPYRDAGELIVDLKGILAGLPDREVTLACSAGAAPYKRTTPGEGGLRDGV